MRRCHPRRRVASHSPKASFREDNGSHDGLGFNNTIPHRSSRIYWNIWGTPTQKPGGRRGLQSMETTSHHEVFWHPLSQRLNVSIITKRLCEGIVSGSIDTPLFSRGVPLTKREDTQTVDQLVVELEASWESRPFTARIRMLRDKIIMENRG